MDITEYVEYLDRSSEPDNGWDGEDWSSWPLEEEDNE